MHKHSKGANCIILKDRVNDPGLAFAGKVGLRPFWTLVQVLSYVHVLQLTYSLRLLLPARAYIYRREDLHEDANARFN
jgi:hypothetical protein